MRDRDAGRGSRRPLGRVPGDPPSSDEGQCALSNSSPGTSVRPAFQKRINSAASFKIGTADSNPSAYRIAERHFQ